MADEPFDLDQNAPEVQIEPSLEEPVEPSDVPDAPPAEEQPEESYVVVPEDVDVVLVEGAVDPEAEGPYKVSVGGVDAEFEDVDSAVTVSLDEAKVLTGSEIVKVAD